MGPPTPARGPLNAHRHAQVIVFIVTAMTTGMRFLITGNAFTGSSAEGSKGLHRSPG